MVTELDKQERADIDILLDYKFINIASPFLPLKI
jgi:hypothetical protein